MTGAINFTALENDFDTFLQNNGVDADVTLHDEGTQFTVKVGVRKAQVDENLTDGLQQNRDKLTVMRKRWDPAASRPPQKGDLFVISGRRRRAMEAQPVEFNGVTNDIIAYNIRISG